MVKASLLLFVFSSQVHGLDYLPELVQLSETNIKKQDKDLLDRGIVHLTRATGWKGLPEHAPYDAIHVGAAAVAIPR